MKSFAHPGDQLVRAGTDDPLVTAHAARRPTATWQCCCVNEDPDHARTVTLDYHGYTPAAGDPADRDLATATAPRRSQTAARGQRHASRRCRRTRSPC